MCRRWRTRGLNRVPLGWLGASRPCSQQYGPSSLLPWCGLGALFSPDDVLVGGRVRQPRPQPCFQDPFLCGGCHLALNGVGQMAPSCHLGDPSRLPAAQSLSAHKVRVAPVLPASVKRQLALQTEGFIKGDTQLHLAKMAPPPSSRGFSVVTPMLASGVHHPSCFQVGIRCHSQLLGGPSSRKQY